MALEDLLYDPPEEGIEVLLEDVEDIPSEELVYDENSENLVFDFMGTEEGDKILRKCAKQVLEDFDTAWDSSEEYRQKIADNYKIYAGFLPKKEWPWKYCSNAHIPIMLEGIARLSSRAYAEIFLQGEDIYVYQPTTPNDERFAEILTAHTNWQITNQITDFTRQMHRALVTFYTNGDVTSHSFYDVWKGRNSHEILTCDEFVTPYVMVTTEPDYSDVPYKIKVLHYQKHELERMKDEWANVDEVLKRSKPSYDDEPEAILRTAHAEVSGIIMPDDDENAAYKLFLYDGYYTMPGDTTSRAVQAVVDPVTRSVLKLIVREEADWQDQVRYEREVKDGESFAMATEMWQRDQDQQAAFRQQLEDPNVDPFEYETIAAGLEADELPPPQPPPWMADGKEEPDPPRMVAIEMYSHGVCMENFLGSLGLSYGQNLADINRAINNNFNLFNDQASLANVSSWIVPDNFDIEPGALNVQPGSINRVTGVDGTQIKNSLVEIKPAQANPQLMDGSKMLYEWGQESVAATGALSGEAGKSGETYRGLVTRVEQALKQLSVSGHKFADFMVQIGRNNGRLNSMFLRDEEIFYVTSHFSGGGQEFQVSKKMYQRNYNVTIRSDLRFASQAQRIAEADQMVTLPTQVLPLQSNLAWWYGAAAKALKARGMHDMLPLLGPKPPPPITPLGVPMPQPGPPVGPDGQPMGPPQEQGPPPPQ